MPKDIVFAMITIGGIMAMSAATFIVVISAPPDRYRSTRARYVAFLVLALGLTIGVFIPIIFG